MENPDYSLKGENAALSIIKDDLGHLCIKCKHNEEELKSSRETIELWD